MNKQGVIMQSGIRDVSRYSTRGVRAVPDRFSLRAGRVHEAFGPARHGFAVHICACLDGPVIWISQLSQTDLLHPEGLAEFCDPGRFVFVRAPGHMDVLWSMEESLRAGAAPVVVAQVTGRIDLTAGRRLQLAAESGGGIGLVLTGGGHANPAAETRWQCSFLNGNPVHGRQDSTLAEWRCIKNKSGTQAIWTVSRNGTAYHISMGSGAAQPAGPAAAFPAGSVRSRS